MVLVILTTVFVAGLIYKRVSKRRAQKQVRMFSSQYYSMAYAASVCGGSLGYQISCLGFCCQQSSGCDGRDSLSPGRSDDYREGSDDYQEGI
jgi:hypothetical protein